MELLLEQTTKLTKDEIEAREHNAQIRERYRRLQDAEASQFAQEVSTAQEREVTPVARYYSPVADQIATVEQAPQITEFVREVPTASIFTMDKFQALEEEKTEERVSEEITPTYVAPATVTSVSTLPQYSLTAFAKATMAVFALIVIAMLTLIAVNSQAIRAKSIRIKNLEEKREELVEQTEELQRRIDAARSEETILSYAQEQGWALGN